MYELRQSEPPLDSDVPLGGRAGWRVVPIHWLSTALTLLYAQINGSMTLALSAAAAAFALYTIVRRYVLPAQSDVDKRLSSSGGLSAFIDVAAFLAFATVAMLLTGGLSSPLLALYFLVVGAAAATLPAVATYSVTGTATSICIALFLVGGDYGTGSPQQISAVLTLIFALWMVSFLIARLATDKLAADRMVYRLSHMDNLTGLWNLRMFKSVAEQELERSQRYQRPFAVAMIDADHLKQVNERFGHEAGGRFICHLADSLRRLMRGSDSLARYGGDEFIVLLPETALEGARTALERLRRQLQDAPMEFAGQLIKITVSIGIATYPRHGRTIDDIIKAADEALYRSKRTGRNQVRIAEVDLVEAAAGE